MNPSVRQKQTQRHRKEASPGCQRGRRMREGTDWEFGVRNGNSFQCSCLENPRDGGAWWAAVYGVAQSRTRLKRLSSSSSSRHRHKLLPIEWMDNKVLLHSTGNYIHCPGINHNGKEYKEECMYVYNRVTLLYNRNQHNIVNQLCFNFKK